MRKRDRLKRGLRQLLGRSDNAGTPKSVPVPPPDPVVKTVSGDAAVEDVAVAQPDPPPPASPSVNESEPPPAEAESTPDAEEEDAKAAEMAAKAAKHFEKTRVTMLKFVVDQGGTASLADMHERSERRYFIGHKRFSLLMEGLVEEELIDFDHATGVATITADGQAYIGVE